MAHLLGPIDQRSSLVHATPLELPPTQPRRCRLHSKPVLLSTTGMTMTVLPVVLAVVLLVVTQQQQQQLQVNGLVDDSSCVYTVTTHQCDPIDYCSFQYRFGDTTPTQSCRVRKDHAQMVQQVHLAYAGEDTGTGMTISWATYGQVKDNAVWIGDAENSLQQVQVQVQEQSYYSDSKYSLFMYHATVLGLKPHTKYFYRVGSASDAANQSGVSSFTTARAADDDEPFTIAVYADNGRDANAQTTLGLINSLSDKVDMAYHIGDLSYADNSYVDLKEFVGFFYEEAYNQWMNFLAPFMSRVPYMVAPGNHEAECHAPACLVSKYKKDRLGNFSAYNARFKMPSRESQGTLNMWYSFEHGPIHFTTISSESDFPGAPSNAYTLTHKNGGFGDQLGWLEQDLAKAHANRDKVPWLIVGMHRPLYAAGLSTKDGVPSEKATIAVQKAFEDLFLKYKVDVVVTGHQHLYERQLPIAKNKAVMDGVSEDKKTYENPQAPVHVVTGAGGNEEGHDKRPPTMPWNAFMDNTHYGINTVQVTRSSLEWKFLASDTFEVLDQFTIVKK